MGLRRRQTPSSVSLTTKKVIKYKYGAVKSIFLKMDPVRCLVNVARTLLNDRW